MTGNMQIIADDVKNNHSVFSRVMEQLYFLLHSYRVEFICNCFRINEAK